MSARTLKGIIVVFLLLPGCGKWEETGDGSDEPVSLEGGGSTVELAQFLDERKARELDVDYQLLKDPFFAAAPTPVIALAGPLQTAFSWKKPELPMLRLCGITHVNGASMALIDNVPHTAGEKAGPFLLEEVARKAIIVSRGGERWVVPIGARLWREPDLNGEGNENHRPD